MPSVPGENRQSIDGDHTGDAIGVHGGERQRERAAHAVADEHGTFEVLVLDELAQVLLQ